MTKNEILAIAVDSGFLLDPVEGTPILEIRAWADSATLESFARKIIFRTINGLGLSSLEEPGNQVSEEHGIYYKERSLFVRRENIGSAFGSIGEPAVRITYTKTGGENG